MGLMYYLVSKISHVLHTYMFMTVMFYLMLVYLRGETSQLKSEMLISLSERFFFWML